MHVINFFRKTCEAFIKTKENNKKQPNKVSAVARHEGRKAVLKRH